MIVDQNLFLGYWLSMLIGCHYDRLNYVYVIFSLPYAFPEYFAITTDIIDTQFNQAGYQLNSLIPMLLEKTHMVSLHIGHNEMLSSSSFTLLKQPNYRGKIFLSFLINICSDKMSNHF
jgi:hypothetical protein